MTQWEEDQEQLEWLAEWRKTHKRWMVYVYDLTPAWEESRPYYKLRYFTHETSAKVYAAWMRLWYTKVELKREL